MQNQSVMWPFLSGRGNLTLEAHFLHRSIQTDRYSLLGSDRIWTIWKVTTLWFYCEFNIYNIQMESFRLLSCLWLCRLCDCVVCWQVLPARQSDSHGCCHHGFHSGSWKRPQRSRLVYICVQLSTGNRGQYIVAVIWAIWSRTECQSHPWLSNAKMQGFWLCYHDAVWRGAHCHSEFKRVRTRQSYPPGLLQNQQQRKAVGLLGWRSNVQPSSHFKCTAIRIQYWQSVPILQRCQIQ